jgi:hypothetical protein
LFVPQNVLPLQPRRYRKVATFCRDELIFQPVHPNDCEIESKCLLGDSLAVNRVRSLRYRSVWGQDRYEDLAPAQGLWGARRNVVATLAILIAEAVVLCPS